jgi:hypothetical protein
MYLFKLKEAHRINRLEYDQIEHRQQREHEDSERGRGAGRPISICTHRPSVINEGSVPRREVEGGKRIRSGRSGEAEKGRDGGG